MNSLRQQLRKSTLRIEQRGYPTQYKRFNYAYLRSNWLLVHDYLPIDRKDGVWKHIYEDKLVYLVV